MTAEPPTPGRARPGRDARRRALGVPPSGSTPAVDAAAAPPAPGLRPSLADELARIPDLERGDEAVAAPAVAPSPPNGATNGSAPPAPASRAPSEAPSAAPGAVPAAVPAEPDRLSPAARALLEAPDAPDLDPSLIDDEEDLPPGSVPPSTAAAPAASLGERRPSKLRRAAFAVTLIVLVAAIPALGYAGLRVIRDSTAGDITVSDLRPTDPGYEAQVDPTPTAVLYQMDQDGVPSSATVMALSGADGGGVVIFVPLDTQVLEPAFGVGRLRGVYGKPDGTDTGARRLATQIGQLMNVGIEEPIEVTNAGLAQLAAPVAPIVIDNPDTLDLGYGITLPAGRTELSGPVLGRYLEVLQPGESDLNRLNRHQLVWSAWLEQIAAAGVDGAVPGETATGIGRYLRTLASGPVTYHTLPVEPQGDGTFLVDEVATNLLVTSTIPAPTGAVPGQRFTVRLLNGVAAEAIPSSVVKVVVGEGGAVTLVGNGPSFDRDETEVVYGNPDDASEARSLAEALGATGGVRLDREAPDTVDLTVILGRDVLGGEGGGAPGSTLPDVTSSIPSTSTGGG